MTGMCECVMKGEKVVMDRKDVERKFKAVDL